MVVAISSIIQSRWKLWALWLGLCVLAVSGCQCGDALLGEKAPRLAANPGTLIFEALPLGDSLERVVLLQNVGEKPVHIHAISVVHESSERAFSLVRPEQTSLELAPQGSIQLIVRYQPKQEGSARGYIRISSDAINADTQGFFTINLRSSMLSPALAPSPSVLDFGIVKQSELKKRTLEVTNRGSVTLTINNIALEQSPKAEFTITSKPSLPSKLAPGKSVLVEVSYSPKQLQSKSQLVFDSSDISKRSVQLLGQKAIPKIEALPKTLVFHGLVSITQTKTIAIYNLGLEVLTIKGMKLDTKSSEFSFVQLPTFPLQLEPGKFTTVEINYLAIDGWNDQGDVVIQSDDPQTPEARVAFSATTHGCILQPSPAKLHFTQSGIKELTLVNQGDEMCRFRSAYFAEHTSPKFSFPSTTSVPPPRDVGFRRSITLQVKYAADFVGKDNGSLVIVSGETTPLLQYIPLSAEIRSGVPCLIRAKPDQLVFGQVEEGKTRQLSVAIVNAGDEDCSIHGLNLLSNSNNAFQLMTALPARGREMKSGESFLVTVAFTPGKNLIYQASLEVTSNDTRVRTLTVPLLGERSRLCIEAVPAAIDFGASKVDCSVGRRSVVVYNLCNHEATIRSIVLGSGTNSTHKEFTIQAARLTPFALKPGQSETIELSYIPKDLGPDAGTLRLQNSNYSLEDLVIPLKGEGVSTDEQTDIFRQPSLSQIDILFVVDSSCSMGDDQTNLGKNLRSLLQWTSQLQLDYHIGVITTDIGKKGCLEGMPKIITAQTSDLINKLNANVSVGTTGSGDERGLESSRLALSEPALSGCNQGFYRKDASLSIIYISDEIDHSRKPVDFYVSFLRDLKGSKTAEKTQVSAIGPFAESVCQANGQCRYYLVTKVFQGVYSHIQNTSWGATLSSLGSLTFGSYSQFFLSRPASPISIQVKINNNTIPQGNNGWIYDSSNNSVRLSNTATPPPNAVIEISYKAICLKP